MASRRALFLVCLVAALHGLFFIWYQRPDWTTEWSDQGGYRRLGQVLAETGKFTRFPDAPRFVPEVIRTPAYPMFVAAVYKMFGVHQVAVAAVQTMVLVVVCVLVYQMALLVASERVALGASAMTALFPPFPYFGALVLTEIWTTLLITLSMWALLHAWHRRHPAWFVGLGFLLAIATLSRPVFFLFPIALGAVAAIASACSGAALRPGTRHWALMLVVFSLTMLPWFAYNYRTLGRFTLSPAGGVGRGLWEGSWQATWSGRVQNELTHLAEDIDDGAELDRRVNAVAARERVPPARMLEYVHQWKDIRRIWTEPADPYARALARVEADREYGRVAIENLKRDTAGHLLKRLARGLFVLWAGEIPVRRSAINRLPPPVIRACWAAQVVLLGLAATGLFSLVRARLTADAWLLAAPIAYITAVHFPLLTEARQSLPAMPVVLLLAAVGLAHLVGRSLALETQVHERQHL